MHIEKNHFYVDVRERVYECVRVDRIGATLVMSEEDSSNGWHYHFDGTCPMIPERNILREAFPPEIAAYKAACPEYVLVRKPRK